MKRFSRSMLGVTLLEIMLVLAIAAMIIVMSVRYYQSATANQQANSVLEQIQAITAAADGLQQGSGTYSGVSTNTVKVLMPNQLMTTPWGGQITVSGSTTSYNVTITLMPQNVCAQISSRLAANPNYGTIKPSPCTAMNTFTYTYTPTN